MAGLKIGSLFVDLSARTDKFMQGMEQALRTVEKVSKRIAKAGQKIGGFAAAFTAAAAVAVAEASKFNLGVAHELDRQKQAWNTVAVEIAQAVLPALRSATNAVRDAVSWWQGLNPELKQSITHAAAMALTFGLVAGAIGKIAGLVGAFATLLSVLLPIAVTLAEVAAGFAVLYGAVLIFRVIWDENLGGIRDAFKAAWDWIVKGYTATIEWLKEGASMFTEAWTKAVDWVKDLFLGWARQTIAAIARVGEALGKDMHGFVETANEALAYLDFVTTKEGLKSLADDAKSFFGKVAATAKSDFGAVQAQIDALIAKFKGLSKMKAPKLVESDEEKARREAENEALTLRNKIEHDAAESVEKLRYDKQQERLRLDHEAAEDEERARNKLAQDVFDRYSDALQSIQARWMGRLGELGDSVEHVKKSIAAFGPGGPMGGDVLSVVASVFIDLVQKSKQFQDIIKVLDDVVQVVADGLGVLIEPLKAVAGAVHDVASALMTGLAPIFKVIAELLGGLAPIIELVAIILTALAPVFKMLADVLKPVFDLILLVFKLLFEGIKWLAYGILWVIRGIEDVWNGILSAIASVFEALGSIEVFGAHPFSFLSDWAKSVRGAMADTQSLTDSMNGLEKLTWDQAMATAEQTAATVIATDKVEKFSEALTNVPDGFKVAAARYDATSVTLGSPTSSGALGARGTVTLNVYGNVYSSDDLVAMINQSTGASTFRRTGIPVY